MSASQEKQARAQRQNERADRKRIAVTEEEKKAKQFRRNTIIVIVVLVIVVAAALVINSNLFYTGFTAVTVGGTNYSAAEVNVFYRNTFNSIYNSFGDYAGYFIDTGTPLTEQQSIYGEGTWADYIYGQTLENMRQVTALYDAAVKEGAPTAEDQETVESQLTSLRYNALVSGFSGLDQYLAAVYGRGVGEKVYTSVLTRMVAAQNYAQRVSEGYSYSQEQLDGWYAEHADTYDVISYYAYNVENANEAFADLEGDEAKASAAHAAAEAIVSGAGDGEAFAANARSFSGDADPAEQHTAGSSLSSAYSEWLLDSGRKAGDTTVIDTDSGSYALLFTGRNGNDYYLTSMRHILIETDADGDGEYTDEEKAAALARIEEIYGEWKENPTEDNFAELANTYSEDSGSNTNGGLYEDITRYYMVPAIDAFLFADGRQTGDHDLVYGQSANYEGWHIVYYAGAHDTLYKDEIADAQLRNSDYSDFIEGLTEGYTTSTGAGLRFVERD